MDFLHKMESQPGVIPSISYAELFHDDSDTRYAATIQLIQALKAHGACRIRDYGISQDIIDNCLKRAGISLKEPFKRKPPTARIRGQQPSPGLFHSQARRSVEKHIGVKPWNSNMVFTNRQGIGPSKEDDWQMPRDSSMSYAIMPIAPQNIPTIHSKQNSFFAPYHYRFEDDQEDNNPLRVPPHIGPTTMLFCFQDSYAGLEVADLSNQSGKLSTTAIEKTAIFTPTNPQPSEFVLLVGHVLRRLVNGVKHSVHRIKRPVGTSGYHLNYWIIPDLNTDCDFADKKEDVTGYLARVFPAALQNTVQV